jgi:hypothetical protein
MSSGELHESLNIFFPNFLTVETPEQPCAFHSVHRANMSRVCSSFTLQKVRDFSFEPGIEITPLSLPLEPELPSPNSSPNNPPTPMKILSKSVTKPFLIYTPTNPNFRSSFGQNPFAPSVLFCLGISRLAR